MWEGGNVVGGAGALCHHVEAMYAEFWGLAR